MANINFLSNQNVDGTLTIQSIANASGDPDKFLAASGGGRVDFVTGSQLLGYIGGTGNLGTVTSVTVQGNTGLSGSGTITTNGTITLTNSDRGSSQAIFKNVLSNSGTAVADNNNDTLSILGGTNVSTSVVGDVLTITATDTNTNNFVTGGNVTSGTVTLSRSGLSNVSFAINNSQITNGAGYVTSSGGSMSSWILKEGNGVETSTVTNGETVTFAQGDGIQSELTSTTSGGTLTITNTKPNIVQTAITGNAATATVLQTARAIAGVAFNGSTAISLNNNSITNGAGYVTSAQADNYGSWRLQADSGSTFNVTSNTAVDIAGGTNITTSVGTQSGGLKVTINNSITNNNQLTNGAGYITSASLPSVGNGTFSVAGNTGLSGSGSMTANQSGNTSATLTNTDRGSSQAIFKNFTASSGGTATANSNNDTLTIAGGSNVSTVRSGDTITINATDTNTNNYLTGLSWATATGVLSASRQGLSTLTVDLDGRYVTSSGVTSIATSTGLSGGTITSTGTLTNTDRGSQQSIFKNIAVSGQNTVVADNNNDTLTFVGAGGMTITTNSSTDTITFNPNDDNTNNYVTGGNVTSGTVTLNRQGLGNVSFAINNSQITNGAGYITAASLPGVGNGTLTVTGGTGMSGSGTFTANQSGNTTITLNNSITNNNQLTNGRNFTVSGSNISQFANNSGYITSGSSISGNAATATKFSTGRTNYKGVTDTSVIGQMMWKNYGNNHTIFDASNGTSPSGSAISATNSNTAWSATYPTLMGWNGSSTYGVRVDRARLADIFTSRTIAGVSFNGSANISLNNNAITNGAGYITSASIPGVGNGTVTFSAGSGLSGGGSITMNQSNSETITFNGFTNNNQLSNGAGYIGIGSVAITSNGSTPSLGSGISALEVRNLIGAGTSSSAGVTSVATGAGLTGGTITSTGTITNTDRGSSQAIFKNFAASSGGTATANSNNDTLTIAAGSNVTTVRSGDTITINATNDGQGVTSVATGGGLTGGTITSTGTLSHADTSSQGSVNNSGNTYIQDVSLDTYGHVTSLTSATTTLATLGYTGATNANYITNNNQLANGAGYNGFTNNNQLTNGRGFVTSSGNTTIGTSTNISTPGSTVISTVSLTQGVVTAFTTRAMTLANLGYTGATNANNITNNNQLTNGAGYITSAGNQGTVTSIGVTLPVLANGSSSGTITTSGTLSLRKPVSGSWHNGGAITVGSDGLSEIGRYLDFHTSNTSTADFDVRLNATSGLLTCSGSFSSTGNISAVGNFVGGYVLVGYGSKGLPTHTFNGDTNTGMFRSNTNEVALTAGGAQNLTCTTTYVKLDGNVGIGTVPSTKLHVDGTALIRDGNGVGDFYIGNLGSSRFIRFHTNNSDTYFDMNCGNILWRQGSSVRFQHTMSSGTFISSGAQIAFGAPSDIRLKENIKPIESALDKVTKLQGVTFDWKKQDIANIKEDIGFIAQDVKKVVPELVREERDGMLSMRHQGVAPLLVEAIKELKAEIEELKKIINKK